MKFIKLSVIICVMASCLSCSVPASGRRSTNGIKIIDEHSKPIQGATVVPFISKRHGLRVGPDGNGPESDIKLGFDEPFLWSSEDQLTPPKLRSSATMFLPMVVGGKDVFIHDWVVLLKGYRPMILTNNKASIHYNGGFAITANGQVVQPFIMKKGGDEERRSIIETLTANPPDLRVANKILNSDMNYFNISEKGRDLLKKQY